VLVVNRKLRVANDVDEQDTRDLELELFFGFGSHPRNLFRRGRRGEFLEARIVRFGEAPKPGRRDDRLRIPKVAPIRG